MNISSQLWQEERTDPWDLRYIGQDIITTTTIIIIIMNHTDIGVDIAGEDLTTGSERTWLSQTGISCVQGISDWPGQWTFPIRGLFFDFIVPDAFALQSLALYAYASITTFDRCTYFEHVSFAVLYL